MVKHLPTMRETWVLSLVWEDLLEKEMATHSSILALKIPRTEEPGGLQSMGSQRVRHDWASEHGDLRKWDSTGQVPEGRNTASRTQLLTKSQRKGPRYLMPCWSPAQPPQAQILLADMGPAHLTHSIICRWQQISLRLPFSLTEPQWFWHAFMQPSRCLSGEKQLRKSLGYHHGLKDSNHS